MATVGDNAKKLITLTLAVRVKYNLFSVTRLYGWLCWNVCPGKAFKIILIFVSKATAYLNVAPFMGKLQALPLNIRPRTNTQLIFPPVIDKTKKFYNIDPRSAKDFVAIAELAEGTHEYKFLVDGEWVNDSNSPVVESTPGNAPAP